MTVTRFDLLVADPVPVFVWLRDTCRTAVVRKMAYHTVAGWHMKIVLDDPQACAAFSERWSADFSYAGKRVVPRLPEEVDADLARIMTDDAG